jgi:hypothetical protein
MYSRTARETKKSKKVIAHHTLWRRMPHSTVALIGRDTDFLYRALLWSPEIFPPESGVPECFGGGTGGARLPARAGRTVVGTASHRVAIFRPAIFRGYSSRKGCRSSSHAMVFTHSLLKIRNPKVRSERAVP